MKMTTLGEVCEVLDKKRKPITKRDRVAGPYPYYGATGILDYVEDWIFDERLILLGEDGAKWGRNEQSAFIIDGRTWVNNHAHVLNPRRDVVDDRYVTYYLNHVSLDPFISGTTIPKLTQKSMVNIQIPLPSLQEQKRIAGILDEADRVRKKTQALIDKYDELAQSLFLDMFGDPVTNPKGWEVKPLGELFQISTGKTPSTKDSENFNGNIPFVTPPDFNSDDETDRFLSEKGAAQSRIVPKGSLLVTCIGSIGKTKIVDLPSCFNQQINAIEIGSGWHPEVLEFAVQGRRSVLEAAASATTVPILNKGNFQKIKVFVPPAELQESFTSRYRQIQRSVGELKSGKEQGQALFNALLQKAFKGEL